jgi:hypothetical protein
MDITVSLFWVMTSWRWRQCISPKGCYLLMRQHYVTAHNSNVIILPVLCINLSPHLVCPSSQHNVVAMKASVVLAFIAVCSYRCRKQAACLHDFEPCLSEPHVFFFSFFSISSNSFWVLQRKQSRFLFFVLTARQNHSKEGTALSTVLARNTILFTRNSAQSNWKYNVLSFPKYD